jgi:transcriptional regulator with XRE-family HTH domain
MHKPHKEYKMKIGANVRKWRDLRGLKQKDLAEMVNLKEGAISNIENDITVPTIHQIEDLADALEINFFQLFSDPMSNINTFNDSPHSIGSIGTQQNQTDKEVLQIMMERMEKKDEQFLSSVKDMFSSIISVFKKEAS